MKINDELKKYATLIDDKHKLEAWKISVSSKEKWSELKYSWFYDLPFAQNLDDNNHHCNHGYRNPKITSILKDYLKNYIESNEPFDEYAIWGIEDDLVISKSEIDIFFENCNQTFNQMNSKLLQTKDWYAWRMGQYKLLDHISCAVREMSFTNVELYNYFSNPKTYVFDVSKVKTFPDDSWEKDNLIEFIESEQSDIDKLQQKLNDIPGVYDVCRSFSLRPDINLIFLQYLPAVEALKSSGKIHFIKNLRNKHFISESNKKLEQLPVIQSEEEQWSKMIEIWKKMRMTCVTPSTIFYLPSLRILLILLKIITMLLIITIVKLIKNMKILYLVTILF